MDRRGFLLGSTALAATMPAIGAAQEAARRPDWALLRAKARSAHHEMIRRGGFVIAVPLMLLDENGDPLTPAFWLDGAPFYDALYT
jgi:hypothetical protein